ncbi:VOC family protein [Rouxiella chamberiensis]|uniref:2-oxoadipate dioxygenase/decarboxylase n=1 Tax=Rouxiella chamberiensis TaxID=1513468 RepID=A0ABY7HTR3_9GAMM|nr:VOC family protein [Rouxiella chamberiensis]WAT02545.1 VOC family protein [Rouxiella chamberiensis]
MSNVLISPDEIRDRFSKAMSQMYQQEVPQYGTLLQIVKETNAAYLNRHPNTFTADLEVSERNRLDVERHGAIRLGTAAELATMKDLFAVMGMSPVGYYDLSAAGVPVHSTAFRPVDEASLLLNPFRVFTSLLRLELIDNADLRDTARRILEQREIFSPRVRELIEQAQQAGGLTTNQADDFVSEALKTFRWHSEAQVNLETYNALLAHHRLIADVVCFKGPHINHLTPRTLDIDHVQRIMPDYGITPKEVIEGPPRRQVPILLRQTSFKALSEQIRFTDDETGKHTARFGEIEQRGLALTPKGRALYDQLLLAASASGNAQDNDSHQRHIEAAFADFPDDKEALRAKQLGYFRYRLTPGATIPEHNVSRDNLEDLIHARVVTFEPIVYEDFLPVSAAGIFQSNLGSDKGAVSSGNPNQAAFEAALGRAVINEFSLYAAIEEASLQSIFGD